MAQESGKNSRSPFELSTNGWSFFTIGVAFFILGLNITAFMAIGIVFMVLAFSIGKEEPPAGESSEEGSSLVEGESQPDSEERGRPDV